MNGCGIFIWEKINLQWVHSGVEPVSVVSLALAGGFFTISTTMKAQKKVCGFTNWTTWIISLQGVYWHHPLMPAAYSSPILQNVQLSICSLWHIYFDMCFNLNSSFISDKLIGKNVASAAAVVVQSPSHIRFFATPWTGTCQASLSLTISQSLPKFMLITSVMLSSHLILWHPFLLLFQWVLSLHKMTKILELQL